VSCPVLLYPATTQREKVSFHQRHRQTGNRIRYKKVDADTGSEVEQDDIIKGYEPSKGHYVELEPEELEAVALESTRMIDIEQFVPKKKSTSCTWAVRTTSCQTVRSGSRRSP
jgi:DNA end-binding protein Ku